MSNRISSAISSSITSEPFPTPHPGQFISTMTNNGDDPPPSKPRRRRLSSNNNLPGEPRGDTGAAAFATIRDQKQDAPTSPVSWHRSASEKARPHSKRRKVKTLFRRWKSICVRHTWLIPLILCLIILSVYFVNPSPSNPVHAGIFLSYPLPNPSPSTTPTQYGKGGRDFAFVAFYTIVLSFTREFLMQRLIRPLALRFGIKSRAKQSRFMEQFYTAMYFAVFGPFGLYVMSRSPVWYFNSKGMFEGFPHRQHEGPFKAYYLLQAAYWSQQALVLLLQLEAPRKDFKELVAHHIITLALIWNSYRFHFAYMGLAVYVTHDISDFFLASSKILNYISSPFTAPYFAIFAVIWAYLRHYLNLRILYSVLTDFRTVGPFELDWDTQQYKCWISQYITFALLAALQSVNIFWFYLILRIAKRYVVDAVVEDERSEYGEEEEVVDASEGKEGRETTAEKRRRMGLMLEKANGEAVVEENGVTVTVKEKKLANGTPNGAPKVLLNGIPVEDTPPPSPHPNGNGTAVRVKSVEVTAQERRRKER